jgi:hypothetical protein
VVDICINNLHEKRRCKREAGLEGLITLLERFMPMDTIDYRYLTVFSRCRASIDKGAAREALLAYRAIGLLALTVGASADCSREILINTLHLPALVKTLRDSSDSAKVVAALDCLAAVTLAAARRPLDVEPSLGIMWSLVKNTGVHSVVSTAAVSLWTLLLTTLGHLGTYPYAGKEATIPFRDLAKLLDTDDPALLTIPGRRARVFRLGPSLARLARVGLGPPEALDRAEFAYLNRGKLGPSQDRLGPARLARSNVFFNQNMAR